MAATKLKDNFYRSYSEFEFSFPIVKCHDDISVCLFALENVTFTEIVS